MNFFSKKASYIILIVCLLIVTYLIRLSSFHNYYLNVDEIVWLYLAKKSIMELIPFIDFDAQTSGFIPIYLIKFYNLFIQIDLKIYRIINVLLLGATFYICNNILLKNKSIYNKLLASIPILFFFYNKDLNFQGVDTEFLLCIEVLILFTILKSKSLDLKKLILYNVFIIILFFTKFQSLIFVLLFSILMPLKFWNEKDFVKLKQTIFTFLILILIVLTCFYAFGTLEEFNYCYIERNLEYGTLYEKSNYLHILKDFIVINIRKFNYSFLLILLSVILFSRESKGKLKFIFFSLISILYLLIVLKFSQSNLLVNKLINYLLIAVILLIVFQILKHKHLLCSYIHKINLDFILSFAVIMTPVITIIISKYNFVHYFVLMIISINILQLEISKRVSTKKALILLVLALITIIPQSYNNLNELKINNNFIHSEKQKLKNNFKLISKHIKKNNRILFLGFISSTPNYYPLLNENQFTSRLANSQFLIGFRSKGKNNYFFRKEDKNLFVDLYNKSPDIIIDFENVIDQITESKSWYYIIKKYDLIENKNIKIFKKK
jgi:hypothetical protein